MRRLRTRFGDCRAGARGVGARAAAASCCEDERHRLLVENDGVFHEAVARLQQRARTHAVGDDRCQRRQSRSHLHRHFRRRRFTVDRTRTVVARHPAQRADAVCDRQQRSVRTHERSVLRLGRCRQHIEKGRDECAASDRSGAVGTDAGRDIRGPQFLRRQGATGADSQSRSAAQRHGADRYHLAVRDFQRSRRLNQELQVHARARGGDIGGRLCAVAARDHRTSGGGRGDVGHHARRQHGTIPAYARRLRSHQS